MKTAVLFSFGKCRLLSLFPALAMVGLATAVSAAPDEERLGRSLGYPVGQASNWFTSELVRVGSFTHQAEIPGLMNGSVHELAPSSQVMPLMRSAREPAIRWHVDALRNLSVDDYLARQRVMGLLVIKDGAVQIERYQYRRSAQDRFLSNSVAKSLVSLAIGLALQDGSIKSIEDPAERYVSSLAHSQFGRVSLRDFLRMASGARFSERYDGSDDLEYFGRVAAREGLELAAQQISERAAEPGQRFNYASADTIVLTLVLRAATGSSLSDYLQRRLWQPMGAESSALWRTDRQGVEIGSGNFNATLRDYGRLGWLLAHDGLRPDTGQQVLPREYVQEATDASRHPPQFAPGQATPYFGYGYQFWTFPGRARRFALLGVYGQMIFVDPALKLVMVQTSANAKPRTGDTSLGREADAFWRGLVAHYGGSW